MRSRWTRTAGGARLELVGTFFAMKRFEARTVLALGDRPGARRYSPSSLTAGSLVELDWNAPAGVRSVRVRDRPGHGGWQRPTRRMPWSSLSKILAVHLTYRSRVEEYAARIPDAPSYFMMPPSALNGHRGLVRRPAGGDTLELGEGELAVVAKAQDEGGFGLAMSRPRRRVCVCERRRVARLPPRRPRLDAPGEVVTASCCSAPSSCRPPSSTRPRSPSGPS